MKRHACLAICALASSVVIIYVFALSAWFLIIGLWIALVPILLGIVKAELSALQPPHGNNGAADRPAHSADKEQRPVWPLEGDE